MAQLKEVVEALEQELRTSEIPDYPGAHNGLQLESKKGQVNLVACAVDASLPVIRKAVEANADLLLVHHGLFWQGVRSLTGPVFEKFQLAIENDLAIYSSHIPLDIHPELGNNVLLCQELGLGGGDPFFDWKGIQLGRRLSCSLTVGELVTKLEKVLDGPVLVRGEKDDPVGQLGVITGGAGSEVESMPGLGIDTFLTGEGPHWSHPLAEELGINVLYGGHYATETFGVNALGHWLESRFGTKPFFLDHPSGL